MADGKIATIAAGVEQSQQRFGVRVTAKTTHFCGSPSEAAKTIATIAGIARSGRKILNVMPTGP